MERVGARQIRSVVVVFMFCSVQKLCPGGSCAQLWDKVLSVSKPTSRNESISLLSDGQARATVAPEPDAQSAAMKILITWVVLNFIWLRLTWTIGKTSRPR